jgi:RND family efflux transporter MFP subunit
MFKPSNRFTTVLIIIFTIALAVGAVLLRKYRTSQVESLAKVEAAPWALHSVRIQKGHLSRAFLALATLNGSTDITISSQISGAIESMGPREGLKVNKGDLLARVSVSELIEQRAGLKAQLQAAEADLSRTQDEFIRQKQLIQKHLTSQELFESKKTAALAAQKQVNNLQRQIAAQNVRIGYGTIYAPADALVAARLSEPGDIAMPGTKLYELTIDTASRLQVKLPQQILEQVHSGTEVLLSYGSQEEKVQLSRIFPALDSHALGTAEADLNSMPFGLPSGARIPARVILESVDNALTIPHRAIIETGDQMEKKGFVFKVVTKGKQNILQRVNVNIVLNAHKALAVSSHELNEDDQVIIAHESILLQLQNNDPVLISPAEQVKGGVSQ